MSFSSSTSLNDVFAAVRGVKNGSEAEVGVSGKCFKSAIAFLQKTSDDTGDSV